MPIQVWIFGGLAAVVLTVGGVAYIFSEGKDAGSSAIKTEVQSKTIETINSAREAKEKADAEVRATPYQERVDGLR